MIVSHRGSVSNTAAYLHDEMLTLRVIQCSLCNEMPSVVNSIASEVIFSEHSRKLCAVASICSMHTDRNCCCSLPLELFCALFSFLDFVLFRFHGKLIEPAIALSCPSYSFQSSFLFHFFSHSDACCLLLLLSSYFLLALQGVDEGVMCLP